MLYEHHAVSITALSAKHATPNARYTVHTLLQLQ